MSIYNARAGGSGGSGYSLVPLSASVESITLTPSQTTADFTVTYNGDGELTVMSTNTSVATVALVSGKTYRVTRVGFGNTSIVVEASIGATTIPVNKVTINIVSTLGSLNNCSWDTIGQVSQAGTAANYWAVGDRKAVTLNGTIGGNLTLSNTTLYVYILGFNHNGSTGIDFGGFKSALTGGADVALVDSGYNSQKTTGIWFNMNNSSSNSNGWKKCRIRYAVLGSTDSSGNDAGSTTATSPVSNTLMAALPSALRAVMKPMTIYSDNTGGASDIASYVTATVDYLPLLAEYEVFGARSYANSAEQSYQAQYQYYINGNSKVKYQHNATATTCYWWLRSVSAGHSIRFCRVSTGGAASTYTSYYDYGVATVFRV